ncbi:MAG: hypothetical protein WAN69_07675 [Candidatus Korobacteraceae bacterium]|jgi:hypothetical protein
MKAVLFLCILGISAITSVAQTDPASASLPDTPSISALINGRATPDNSLESGAAIRDPVPIPNAPSASPPQFTVKLAFGDNPDQPFSPSQTALYDFFVDTGTPSGPAIDLPHADDSSSSKTLALQPVEPPHPDTKVHWAKANGEALLSTGIMHTFNLWTEAGTRDALYGPWAKDWLRSVSELRGWSDSDQFMAPYVGHPIQGSIFGFILRQNDPLYRDVQWGDGRDYFMSLLRSMAFSAVWHTQWKIGIASEASIGNVMLHASPGFITLVDTPTLGAITMIGEDALDRYLIMGLENRTANRPLIALTRCFLNPGRSFANLMAFRVPWHRDTRMGIVGQNFIVRKELLADYRAGGPKPFEFVRRPNDSGDTDPNHMYPKEAPIELAAYPNFEHFSGRNCIGGGGSGATRFSPTLQIVAEVNGCLIMGFSHYTQSGDSLFYGAGPRWTPLASRRVSPFAEVLFGGRKVTYEVDNPQLEKTLLDAWNDGSGTLPHYPKRSDWSTEAASNGPSLAAGGGVDVVVTRPFTWRLVNVQYTHSWMGGVDNIHPENGIRITTEAVLRIGTW